MPGVGLEGRFIVGADEARWHDRAKWKERLSGTLRGHQDVERMPVKS